MLDDRMLLEHETGSEQLADKGNSAHREEATVNRSKEHSPSSRSSTTGSTRFPKVDWNSFKASAWVRGGHLQTILGSYLPHRLKGAPCEKYLAPTTHGDQLLLLDSCPPSWKTGDRLVLLAHGLGGCGNSPYIRRMAGRLYEHGFRAVRLNLRGAGAGFAYAKQLGHAGRSEDIAAGLQFVVEQAPESPICVIGYSMGANLILKHFGELGEAHPQVDRILAIAPPIDLMACMKNMLFREGWVYDRAFAAALRKLAARRERELPGAPHRPVPKSVRRLFDFDDHYTAPLSGFKDAVEYYEYASAKRWIPNIRIPTTIVAADDDPLIPANMFDEFVDLPYVEVKVTRSGGHLGYLSTKSSDPDRRWLDWRLLEWVKWNAEL